MSASGWTEKKIEGNETAWARSSGSRKEVRCVDYVRFIDGNLSSAMGMWSLNVARHRDPQDQVEIMEKPIEFYIPKRFRQAFVRADQAQAGKVIEFCPGRKAQASIRPSGGFIAWSLSGTASSPAADNESA
jgi:hypothetical protein